MIRKLDLSTPCLTKTGAATLSIKAGTRAVVADRLVSFAADTAVTMPALTAGTDYAVYVTIDGKVLADANFSAPAGYNSTTCLKIGGFHYALGGNATAQAGGDAAPAINSYSIWDLKFRPSCPDPRGMVLIANGFWTDIYLLNTTPDSLGTSAANATICDGSSPAKVPAAFGGNGSASYGSLTWHEAGELLSAFGKRLPSMQQFEALAYGVTENGGPAADPVTTKLDNARTSKWGVIQATGNMWIWGLDGAVDPTAAGPYAYQADTGGRGQSYIPGAASIKRVLLGASWGDAANAGSRCSVWSNEPSNSGSYLGARGVCDHLVLP